ncbi:HEPN/Toprim-associated domain-containing protein [Corallococcus sp. AS-1-12]|uniref:HEPN/Toprim-associated domain-containing protein n=1 Tax=Corallococcus sp. AS-1-12 TaxID=2874598 RepID=UPI001CC0E3E1|nr:HEPN/Toprim-associated domain-containing protein [Corallococcus sp. AS-1-12]MBZ4329651.1 hypothetical protein [Corallococcus sp. AS-1-12]
MGTLITLDVGGITLTHSKNSRGTDHGSLFQEQDRKATHSDQINYEYFKETGKSPTPMEMALSRTLRDVIPRIELLGFTLESAKREYEEIAQSWTKEQRTLADEDEPESSESAASFEEFKYLVTRYSISTLDDTFADEIDLETQARTRGRFAHEPIIERLPNYDRHENFAYSERSYFSDLVSIIHPYSVLRVLATRTDNLDATVVWQYGPLVESGWASAEEFPTGARRTETFLVATEGSSDAHILKHAFTLLKPEIADFFRFIDVSERHPFSGTGNLLKFAEGLAKIDVHNQVVFVFDNDAEGFDAHQRLLKFSLPTNMRTMLLPELEQFRSFPARGPEGVSAVDINRRAAAIECYLDLSTNKYPCAKIVWTNYKKELDTYQGSLEFKESYVKDFLELKPETLTASAYDVSKISAVLDAIILQCSSIAAAQRERCDE